MFAPTASVALLVICALSGLEAVGPVVSNNQWTPVVNSRRVYLSPEVLAKYKQEEQEAQERFVLCNIRSHSIYIVYLFRSIFLYVNRGNFPLENHKSILDRKS